MALHDQLVRGVRPTRLELDELWSYVYAKRERNLQKRERALQLGPRKRQAPLNRGQRYTWIALDPDSRAVVSYYTAYRDADSALAFTNDLNLRVVSKPMISSDAYPGYADALQRSFGTGMDHVVMHKRFKQWFNPETGETGKRLVGLEKIPQNQSKVSTELASTSHVERMNANIRHYNARFTRQTYRFSKKLENHVHALAICIMYHNFVRSNFGFNGTPYKHWSPAMKAGITEETWAYERLLNEIEEYWQNKAVVRKPPALTHALEHQPISAGQWTDDPYFVSYSQLYRHAKVHAARCRDCRRAAAGRKDGPKANAWYGFKSKHAAMKWAEALAPVDFSVCSICILGRYPGSIIANRGPQGRKMN
jgi:IS1 family transposase